MKKQNAILTTITLLLAATALTGCGNQKSSASVSSNSAVKSTEVTKSPKTKASVKSSAKENANTEKITKTEAKAETTQAATATTTPQTATKAETKTNDQTKVTVTKPETQVDVQTLGLDSVTQKQLVNVVMGQVATATNMPAMENGYWDYAKTNWGITDAQVLVKTGNNTFQIFSQGAEQYTLTVDGQVATMTARSNYTQTTKVIKVNIQTMGIISSTY